MLASLPGRLAGRPKNGSGYPLAGSQPPLARARRAASTPHHTHLHRRHQDGQIGLAHGHIDDAGLACRHSKASSRRVSRGGSSAWALQERRWPTPPNHDIPCCTSARTRARAQLALGSHNVWCRVAEDEPSVADTARHSRNTADFIVLAVLSIADARVSV